jgi:predicted aspartyl protease
MELKIEPNRIITFFVKVKGKKGTSELRAVLDTGAEYCVIPKYETRLLGYDTDFDEFTNPGEGTRAITIAGIIEGDELEIEEVQVADLVAKNIKAIVTDLPNLGGVQFILGLSFLAKFKTAIDYSSGYLTIEPI